MARRSVGSRLRGNSHQGSIPWPSAGRWESVVWLVIGTATRATRVAYRWVGQRKHDSRDCCLVPEAGASHLLTLRKGKPIVGDGSGFETRRAVISCLASSTLAPSVSGAVAQLEEHSVRNREVMGSSPIRSTNVCEGRIPRTRTCSNHPSRLRLRRHQGNQGAIAQLE